jgi:hypothetical protein
MVCISSSFSFLRCLVNILFMSFVFNGLPGIFIVLYQFIRTPIYNVTKNFLFFIFWMIYFRDREVKMGNTPLPYYIYEFEKYPPSTPPMPFGRGKYRWQSVVGCWRLWFHCIFLK